MTILYQDAAIVVCIKPWGVNSTDVPGGLPELLRAELGDAAQIRTVHRLDQVVGGVMVLARTAEAASELTRQIRENRFEKEYLAVCHFRPAEPSGVFRDLLRRDPKERKTYVTHTPGKDVQEASLSYTLLEQRGGLSLVQVRLHTGRTHQIRVQFSSRGLPLFADKKYSRWPDAGNIGLWSHRLQFCHPLTGEAVEFSAAPPKEEPWIRFDYLK